MADTYQFGLPLVAAAQAQKHVTVNEALARLDALAQLRVISGSIATPPASAPDGAAYIVPTGASGVWAGQADAIAIWENGGWLMVAPKPGWWAWNEATAERWQYDGAGWRPQAAVVSPGGAASLSAIVEIDHDVAAGATSTTLDVIPSHSSVLGVTGRVLQALTGSGGAVSWRLGVPGADNRYGSGLGFAAGSFVSGLTGAPQAYYADTPLVLTPDAGSFAGGRVRFAVHYMALVPPR